MSRRQILLRRWNKAAGVTNRIEPSHGLRVDDAVVHAGRSRDQADGLSLCETFVPPSRLHAQRASVVINPSEERRTASRHPAVKRDPQQVSGCSGVRQRRTDDAMRWSRPGR